MPRERIQIDGKKTTTLKWLLRPGLKAVFVGVNPPPVSVAAGHYHQGRLGRRLWARIHEFEITDPLPGGHEDLAAFAQGFGFADIVRRPTVSATELTEEELIRGSARLVRRLKALPDRPIIVFVYATAANRAEKALKAEGFETFRLPGPYENKSVVAARLKALRAKLARRSARTREKHPPLPQTRGALGIFRSGDGNEAREVVPPELLSSVRKALNPSLVILFGSHARGAAGPDSDWDLLVVIDDDVPANQIDWRAMHAARYAFRGAVDLVPCHESDFRDRAEVVGSLPWIASTQGVVVYERAESA